MKKCKPSEVVNENDIVHVMGIGMSFYGGHILGEVAVLQIGALKKRKSGKVAQKDIDNSTGKSYIMFSDVEAIDNLMSKLTLLKKGIKKKSRK